MREHFTLALEDSTLRPKGQMVGKTAQPMEGGGVAYLNF